MNSYFISPPLFSSNYNCAIIFINKYHILYTRYCNEYSLFFFIIIKWNQFAQIGGIINLIHFLNIIMYTEYYCFYAWLLNFIWAEILICIIICINCIIMYTCVFYINYIDLFSYIINLWLDKISMRKLGGY